MVEWITLWSVHFIAIIKLLLILNIFTLISQLTLKLLFFLLDFLAILTLVIRFSCRGRVFSKDFNFLRKFLTLYSEVRYSRLINQDTSFNMRVVVKIFNIFPRIIHKISNPTELLIVQIKTKENCRDPNKIF